MASSTYCLLLALVAVSTGSLASTCDDTCQRDCSTKLNKCQQAISGMGGPGGSGYAVPEGGDGGSQCSATQVDPCSMAKELEACLDKLSHCETVQDLKTLFTQLRQMANQYCSPQIRCGTVLQKCSCIVTGVSPEGSNPLQNLCPTFGKFSDCIKNVPDDCKEEPTLKKTLEFTNTIMNGYNRVICQGGACLDAVECLRELGEQTAAPPGEMSPGIDLPSMPAADQKKVCPSLSVFDCLNTASEKCKIDQGTVSMTQIKKEANVFCTGAVSKAFPTLENCKDFQGCLMEFEHMPDFVKNMAEGGMPDEKTIIEMMDFLGTTTRTGFWCSWIKHNYYCVEKNAATCKVPEQVVTIATQKNADLATMCAGAAMYTAPDDAGDAAVTLHRSLPLMTLTLILCAAILN